MWGHATSPAQLNLIQQRLLLIAEQLAQGWQIQLPVIAREAYCSARGCERVFDVVLANQHGQRRAIALPAEPEVEHFLFENEYPVLEL